MPSLARFARRSPANPEVVQASDWCSCGKPSQDGAARSASRRSRDRAPPSPSWRGRGETLSFRRDPPGSRLYVECQILAEGRFMADALRLFLIEDDDDIALLIRRSLER